MKNSSNRFIGFDQSESGMMKYEPNFDKVQKIT